MRQNILILIFSITCFCANAQNSNPYEIFGHHSTVKYETPVTEMFYIKNSDTTSFIKAVAFDFENSSVKYLGLNDTLIKEVKLETTQLLRWLSVDPKASKLPSQSPYNFCVNNPIILVDPDGQFPILVNGKVGSNSERGSSTYWSANILNTVSNQTGYKQSDFMFVDGDRGFWPGTRTSNGVMQGKVDAVQIYARLKASAVDGQITEQLQFITHSRGGAFGNGYMQGVSAEVAKLAKADGLGFAYGENNIVQYSANIAPHQSNWINYPNNGSMNVNVSHIGDPLSGNDATGNVINVQSIPPKDAFDQHGNDTYNTELNMVLGILESNTNKSQLFQQVKTGFDNYDKSRTNGDKSKVTQGK